MRSFSPIPIYAVSSVAWPIEDELPPLRARVKEVCGKGFRRVNRFIQLALIGSQQCAADLSLDSHCGLYLASGQGALQDSVDVLQQMALEGQPPRPLSFVNTLSNTPCFYVAQNLGLTGANQFISNRPFPFEAALSLAALDFECGVLSQALVGGVDECILPLEHHRERLGLGAGASLGEGSHWLLLARDLPVLPLGELLAVREFPDRACLEEWFARLSLDVATARLEVEGEVTASEVATLRDLLGLAESCETDSAALYHETVSGANLCRFLTLGKAEGEDTLVHVSASGDGRYAALVLRRCPAPRSALRKR